MQKIDAHQHFWVFDPVRDSWISEDMAVLRKDFLPADLQPLLQEAGIEGCVAVQADQSEAETAFLLQMAKEYSFIKGVVGWVDLQAEDIEDRLDEYHPFPLVKGFRHILQGETDRALMLKPAFRRGLAALAERGFTYDLLIFPDQLGFSKKLVAAFPYQKFVVDHLAKPGIKNGALEEWTRGIQELAMHSNVYCKVSGLVTEADWNHWKLTDFAQVLDSVVAAFGTRRLIYGSDWPVCLLAGSYRDVLGIVQDYFSSFSKDEQDLFFGGNAIEFYNL
jgi:L-fuconolactonase